MITLMTIEADVNCLGFTGVGIKIRRIMNTEITKSPDFYSEAKITPSCSGTSDNAAMSDKPLSN